jgi:hypothetical protein
MAAVALEKTQPVMVRPEQGAAQAHLPLQLTQVLAAAAQILQTAARQVAPA